jgi:D-arabinose 1-dehydrogenase-like Zn-dependent alcohol dehydrogenase
MCYRGLNLCITQVLGHESAGIIKKGALHSLLFHNLSNVVNKLVGAKVRTVKVGDRVALEPGATCRVCDQCKAGKYQVRPRDLFKCEYALNSVVHVALPADGLCRHAAL